jgi:hypothetical protein
MVSGRQGSLSPAQSKSTVESAAALALLAVEGLAQLGSECGAVSHRVFRL